MNKRLNKKIVEEILNALDGTVWGMTIEELSEVTGRHRNTLAKYLSTLEKIDLVVRRSIGKYTFWLLSATYRFRTSDAPMKFFQHLSNIIDAHFKKGEAISIFEISRKIGYILASREEFLKIIERLSKQTEPIEYLSGLLGIFLPSMLPRLRFKINEFDFDDNKIRISVSKCPCNGNPKFKSSCISMGGFLQGVMEKIGLEVEKIEEIDCQINGASACTFEATLKKKIREYFPAVALEIEMKKY